MNWKITDEGSKSKDLDAGNVTIQFYELEAEKETGYFEVANIGGQSLFVNYKTTNQQGNTYELNLTRLVPKYSAEIKVPWENRDLAFTRGLLFLYLVLWVNN